MSSGRSPRELRRRNRSAVLREVLRRDNVSRTDLAALTGLTNTAITRITRELIDLGLLCETQKQERDGQPGRRRTVLEVNPKGAYVIGVGIHASDHSVSLANLRGDLIHREIVPVELLEDAEMTLSHIGKICARFVSDATAEGNHVLGIGVACAGVVDTQTGTIIEIPQFGWRNVAVSDCLGAWLDIPVFVDNVNNTLNLAEWRFGVAKGAQNVLMIRASTFVGGSVVSGGYLATGHSSRAAQLGHMSVNIDGARCVCGRRGCINTVASGISILAKVKRIPVENFRSEDVDKILADLAALTNASDNGDVAAQGLLFDAGRELGRAVAAVSSILDPELILLGGPIGRNDSYADGVRAGLADNPSERLPDLASVEISRMSIPQATVFTALDYLAFSPRLDVEALQSTSASRKRYNDEFARM